MTITNPYTVSAVNTAIGSLGNHGSLYSNNSSTITLGSSGIGVASITSSNSLANTLQVKGDIDVQGGDVKIDGVSLKQVLESITERLHILTPDPQKLEKFEALKRAYEHYKLLEKLCHEDKKD